MNEKVIFIKLAKYPLYIRLLKQNLFQLILYVFNVSGAVVGTNKNRNHCGFSAFKHY